MTFLDEIYFQALAESFGDTLESFYRRIPLGGILEALISLIGKTKFRRNFGLRTIASEPA